MHWRSKKKRSINLPSRKDVSRDDVMFDFGLDVLGIEVRMGIAG